jgi:TRAP-type C4-dicarboxylate transport system permease small subunit
MRVFLRKLDKTIHKIERAFVGYLFLAMSVVVFVDVLHRVFSRQPGRLSVFFAHLSGNGDPQKYEVFLSPLIISVITFIIAYFAIKTHHKNKKTNIQKKNLLIKALIGSALAAGATQAFIYFDPQGVIWAPYFGLICLLWIGFIGASMATHTNQHLLLEMGEKLWPQKFLPAVRTIAHLAVGLFVLTIAYLGILSVIDHYHDWQSGPQAGLIPSIDWPKWMVYLVIPYSFLMMGLRFWGIGLRVLEQAQPPELVPEITP